MNGRQFAAKRGRILARARSERHARKAIEHMARKAGAQPVRINGKLIAHVFPDGFVVCEKRRFRDEAAALDELAGVRAFEHLHAHKLPGRAYQCANCGGWHMTSQPRRT